MSESRQVVHLHNHTGYSSLDGTQKLTEMCAAAAADGQPAIAITDHESMGGAWKFAAAAKKAGIKPILGVEMYLAVGRPKSAGADPSQTADRFEPITEWHDREQDDTDTDAEDDADAKESAAKGQKRKPYYHLTVLVQNEIGWRNLVAINNKAQDTRKHHALADFELLREHNEGLIVLTGCLGGPVAHYLNHGMPERAEENLRELLDIFPGRVFVEVMHHGIPAENRVIPGLVKLAAKYDLKVVATNDAHYTHAEDAEAHDCWLCVGTGKRTADTKRFRFNGSGYHLRTADEMHEIFDAIPGCADAVANTLHIADLIDDDVLPESRLRLPKFQCPDGLDSASYLHQLVLEGAKRRYGTPLPVEVKQRLRYEENTIVGAGLEDYLLIVWDIINATRAAGHRVGYGRGSAAGCAISYCLGIVGVDPIRYNLLFERFINPDRAGMPDIDTDFDSAGRDFAIRYTIDKYGVNMVAKIGTYGMALSKKAIKDVARATSVPATGAKLSKQVPNVAGKPLPLTKLLDEGNSLGAPFRSVLDTDPFAPDVVRTAQVIEGVVATEGVHACGVLISDTPLDAFVPLRWERKKVGQKKVSTGIYVTQFDGKDVDAMGLLKKDFLGLRNLDVVTKAVELIEVTTGEHVDTYALPDPTDHKNERVRNAYSLLAQGKTAGVFQLESSGITKLCEQIAPQNLDDIAAILALYRPGPLGMGMHERYAARKAGREAVDYGYLSPDPAEQAVIASVLDETFGTIVYQEQLMRLAVVVAGFNPGQSNKLQKAFSKKIREQMEEVGAWFLDGGQREIADESGTVTKIAFSESTLRTLWRTFEASADYLFNKSHASGYGYLTYVTAFLKANWPAQYGAALLSVTKSEERRLPLLNALLADGIAVLAPDVNLGFASTGVDAEGNVRLGLSEVKGVGTNAKAIVDERKANGPFSSLADLMTRVKVVSETDGKVQNIGSNLIQGLIEAGACDSFGPRMGLAAALLSMRDCPSLPIPAIEWGVVERSQRQRQRLGVITDGHPLVALRTQLREWREPGRNTKPQPLHRLTAGDGDYTTTIGVVAGYAEKTYSKGRMANLTIEGSSGTIECVIWNETMETLKALDQIPVIGEVVGITGRINVRRFTVKLDTGHEDEGLDGTIDDDDEEAEQLAVTEEVERREMTIQKLWRGELVDEAAPLARSNVLPFRRAGAPVPPTPKPRKPRATKSSEPVTEPARGAATRREDAQRPQDAEIAPVVALPMPAAASTASTTTATVTSANVEGPVIPLRRADAGEAVVLKLKAATTLDNQLIDGGTARNLLDSLKVIIPALAYDDGEQKLRDWLFAAEPGERSDEFTCFDGSAVVFEASTVRGVAPAIRRFTERMFLRLPKAS